MFNLNNTKYNIIVTSKFKKQFKQMVKQNKDISKLIDVITKLANDIPLNKNNNVHFLINDKYFNNCLECHIELDWLLIYKYSNDKLFLYLMETGSHSQLFK